MSAGTKGAASAAPAPRCGCPRVDVLCGCGWGRLAVPACHVPAFCPLCGFDLWETFGAPEPCDLDTLAEWGGR